MEPLDQTSGFKATDGVLDGHDQAADERAHAPVVAQPIGFRERYVLSCPLHVHFRWWIWDRPSDVQYAVPALIGCLRAWKGALATLFRWCQRHSRWDWSKMARCLSMLSSSLTIRGDQNRGYGISLVWLRTLDLCDLHAAGVKIPINLWNPGLSVSFVGLSKMGNWTLQKICLSVQRGFTIAYTM